MRSVGQHSKSSLFYLHLVIWLLEINSLKCRMFYNIDNNEFVADDENYIKKKNRYNPILQFVTFEQNEIPEPDEYRPFVHF